MRFSIKLLSSEVAGSSNVSMGEIRVGSFIERFAVHAFIQPIELIESQWRCNLEALVAGADAVALPTASNMTWLLYRFGKNVKVRQTLMLPGKKPKMMTGGKVVDIPPYLKAQLDGGHISEWTTTVDAIRAFLAE